MAERTWNKGQKNAIEADSGSVLVSAAAGSGKTSVLVERIVRKLISSEKSVPPESLLVVTFTNAAAQEMRGRIYSRIAKAAADDPERRSEFTALLSGLNEMQVCTMDSFCMNLVRENCYALGIDNDFTVLEDAENSSLKNKAAVSVLERRFRENSDTFLPLARMFDSGKNDAKLIETVIKLSDFAKSEPYPELWLDEILDRFYDCDAHNSVWGQCIINEVSSALEFCSELFDAAIECIGEDELIHNCYYPVFESERQLLRKAAERFNVSDWDGKVSALKELHKAVYADKLKSVPRGYGDSPVKLSATEKRDYIKSVLDKITGYMSISSAEHKEDLEILGDIAKELTVTVKEYDKELLLMKKELSKYDFSDISHFALKLLCDPDSFDQKTPLAREMTEEFSEILIDEYQDTNRAQETLFCSLSKNGENMFFVGDVKQSIYRFRLASPEIFIEKCEAYPYYDGVSKKSKIILGENFRSRKGILDAVNFVFSSLMSPECGDIDYNEDERLNFPAVKTAEDSVDVSVAVLETGDEKAFFVEARYIARTIEKMIADKVQVEDKDGFRNAVPSDFCILMRSPASIARFYTDELKNCMLPVSSDVNRSFFDNPEIKTVMSYLRVIDNPVRDIDMAAVMMSPLFGFTPDDTATLRLKYGKEVSLYAAAVLGANDGDEKCRRLVEKLGYYRRASVNTSVDMLIRDICNDTAYFAAAGAMPNGRIRQKNIRLLIEEAADGNERFSGLPGFVRYMEMMRENEADISDAGSGDGVRIMSMHKSKGLEFPFVFIAGSAKGFNKTDMRSNLIINHEMGLGIKRKEPEKIKNYDTLSSTALKICNNSAMMSEELRVYYVALTRAKQKLFITIPHKNALKYISENEYLLYKTGKISPYIVKNASDANGWLIKCFLKHPDGGDIRFFPFTGDTDCGRAEITLVEEEMPSALLSEEEETVSYDESIVEDIRKRASFRYKWLDIASARASHSASSLSEEHFDPAGFAKSVPAFMYSSSFSPTDIGTFTHRFLQFCDFGKCKTDAASEFERLIKEGRLTEKEAAGVDIEAINAFVHSDIMRRVEKASAVFREKQFSLLKSICETDSSIPSEFSDEKTVIFGKIDLLFIEDDGAVIVDYKTDNINKISVLAERYRTQMILYIEAFSKAMGIKVKECILYSIKLRDSISLEF